jgi:hypothetical protein
MSKKSSASGPIPTLAIMNFRESRPVQEAAGRIALNVLMLLLADEDGAL